MQLFKVFDFHLDFHRMGNVLSSRLNRLGNATGAFDMIIFNHNRIIEAKAMIIPPPTRTAYFSSNRCPGVVFRVSTSLVGKPSKAHHILHASSCAIPDNRCIKFSASRSPNRIFRVLPSTSASRSLYEQTILLPLLLQNEAEASTTAKTLLRNGKPANDSVFFDVDNPFGYLFQRDCCQSRDIACADIFFKPKANLLPD